jgi:glutamine synthetase
LLYDGFLLRERSSFMGTISKVTYIWLDGKKPTQRCRCKTRILYLESQEPKLEDFPQWGFDGSSTYQAEGQNSDLLLEPVRAIRDPLSREGHHYLLLCEVLDADGKPHTSNTRAALRVGLQALPDEGIWIGFEQEYTLFKKQHPLGWPEGGYPAPQGPFYCGVGADEVFGRPLVMEHTQACLDAGLMIFGTNAEVMPGQWEFQIGYRAFPGEEADPLTVSDHLWLARWLLYRLGENYTISVKLDPKPIAGDWNGAGMHTNFSTAAMRDPKTGQATLDHAVSALEATHDEHVRHYGAGLARRLTGSHETASIDTFSCGISDRGCSIRIPRPVADQGYGYFEDRRPGANADPYVVSNMLVQTVCFKGSEPD